MLALIRFLSFEYFSEFIRIIFLGATLRAIKCVNSPTFSSPI